MPLKSPNEIDGKFNTCNQRLLQIWDEIQCVQTDFCFPQELSAYYMSDHWLNHAQSVLDVGTGNGYFLSKILEKFPGKQYVGIDISVELTELASQKLQGLGVELLPQDYFDHAGVYDFVIMRLFWQHLPENRITEALEKLEELVQPGASVLISDAYDEIRRFVPDMPAFRGMIKAYATQQTAVGRNRNIINLLLNWAESTNSWHVGDDIKLIIPSSIHRYRNLFGRIYELWIELFECLGELEIDFTPAKQELTQWSSDESAFTQAGLRVVRLDRVA